MAKSKTLLHYLSKPVPQATFDVKNKNGQPRGKSSSSARNVRYGTVERLLKWKDFNYDLVHNLFERRLHEVLTQERENLKDIPPPSKASLDPNREPPFHFLAQWVVGQHVQEALDHASESILGQRIELLSGAQVALLYDDDTKKFNHRALDPDWGCKSPFHLDKNIPPEKPNHNNMLPGDSKWKWNSSDFRDAIGHEGYVKRHTHKGLWPLRQVLTYCVKSHSRYGFIFSETELIVMRCSSKFDMPAESMDLETIREQTMQHGVIEWAVVPWQRPSGPKGWTTKLALFCLSILAANNGRLVSKQVPFDPLEQERLIPHVEQEMLPMPPRSYDEGGNRQESQSSAVCIRDDRPSRSSLPWHLRSKRRASDRRVTKTGRNLRPRAHRIH